LIAVLGMRLFIACALPEEFVNTLTAAQRVLKSTADNIRITGKEQLHLTLRFIGEAGEDMVQKVTCWFKTLHDPGSESLLVRQGEYGAFATREEHLIWSGLSCRPELLSYVRRLEEGLCGLGLSPEWRRWMPHVTLARHTMLSRPFEDISPSLPMAPHAFPLSAPALYKSEFTPDGVRYTLI
jgi:2'-5' RNA ligase